MFLNATTTVYGNMCLMDLIENSSLTNNQILVILKMKRMDRNKNPKPTHVSSKTYKNLQDWITQDDMGIDNNNH